MAKKCFLYTNDQIDEATGEPFPDAVGVDIDDKAAVQRFLLENAHKIDPEMLGEKPKLTKEQLQDSVKSGVQDVQKTIEKALNSALDVDVKSEAKAHLIYDTLSNDKQLAIMDEVAAELGSVDNILFAANNYNLFPWQRVLLYNAALKQLAAEAKGLSGKERTKNIDKQTETLLALKDAGSEYARGLQAFQIIYKSPASPLAIQMAVEQTLKQGNEAIKQKRKKAAKEVLDEMNKDYKAGDVVGDVENALTGEPDIEKEQEKIDAAKKVIKGERKGSKNNPIKIFERAKKESGTLGAAMDTLDKAAKMSLLPDNLQSALNEVVRHAIKQGATSIVDIAEAVNKRWNGKLNEGIETAYNNARVELQAENIEFDTEEETARVVNEIRQAAKDIVEANAKIVQAKLDEKANKNAQKEADKAFRAYEKEVKDKEISAKKQAETLIKKYEAERSTERKKQIREAIAAKEKEIKEHQDELKRIEKERDKIEADAIKKYAKENQSENANVIIAEKFLNDINNLRSPNTKKEQSLVKQVAAAYQAKVRELLSIKTNGKQKTAEQILKDKASFASEAMWEDIRKSVIAAIENDKTLSKEDKKYLKDDFLAYYIDSGIKTLLTKNDTKKVISAALKDFDWNIRTEESVDKAKQRVRDYVSQTTTDKAVLDQIDKAFDEAVKNKRVNAIKGAIKAKQGSRAKAKVIKAVDKLATMVAHGGLDIDGVFDVLSDEFGLVSLTAEQKAELEVLSNNLYNAPQGYLKDNARHKIAAFVNEIVLNNWSKLFQTLEAGAVINLFTPETLAVNFIGSGFEWLDTLDIDTFRNNQAIKGLSKDELAKAVAAFKTIWEGGSAYIESYTESIDKATETGGGSKEHSLNTLESKSGGKLLGIVPEIWATVDGKIYDVNPLNQLQMGVRRIGRAMNAGDAFFMVGINNKMAFNIRQNQLILQGVDKVTAANQARTEVYGGDMNAARLEAARDVARAGELPTKANIDRRAAEILRKSLPNDVDILAEQITMEQTFKAESPHGMVGFVTKWALQAAPIIIRSTAFGVQGHKGLLFGLQNSKNKNAAAISRSIVNTSSKYVMPFTSGISFIAERVAEMIPPYAAIKVGLNYAKIKSTKDITIGDTPIWTSPKTQAEVAAFQVRNQLLVRKALKGTAFMMVYLAAKALSDDDEDGIYGDGNLQAIQKGTPNLKRKRVVVIGGVAMPFKMFPDMEPLLNAYGAIEDMRRAGIELTPSEQASIVTSAYFDTGYMEGLNRLKLIAEGNGGYMEKTVLNGLVNSIMPMAGTSRWLQRNFTDPYRKDVANMGLIDQLKYYSGATVDEKYNVRDIHGNLIKIQYEYPNLTRMNADYKSVYDNNATASYKHQMDWGFVMKEPRQTELFFDEDKSEMFSLDQTVEFKNIMKETFGKISDNSQKANKQEWKDAPKEAGLKYSNDIEAYAKSVAKFLMLKEYKKDIPKDLKETIYKASGDDAKIKPLFFYLPQETKNKITKALYVPETTKKSYSIGNTDINFK